MFSPGCKLNLKNKNKKKKQRNFFICVCFSFRFLVCLFVLRPNVPVKIFQSCRDEANSSSV